MKRFFKAMAKYLNEAVEIMSEANTYSIDYPAYSMGTYRMF